MIVQSLTVKVMGKYESDSRLTDAGNCNLLPLTEIIFRYSDDLTSCLLTPAVVLVVTLVIWTTLKAAELN